MPWSLGSFTFPTDYEPLDDSEVPMDDGEQAWSEFYPIGASKTILTYLGAKSAVWKLHCILLEAHVNSLKTIYNARAEVELVSPYKTVDVMITSFTPRVNRCFVSSGINVYDAYLILVER